MYEGHVVQFPINHSLKEWRLQSNVLRESCVLQHLELAPIFLQELCLLQNPRKENEGRCKARSGMNAEINVCQTQEKAVAMNLQLKPEFMEIHLFPSLSYTQHRWNKINCWNPQNVLKHWIMVLLPLHRVP